MTELSILFVNDINNEKLLTYFINDDEIKDYFKIHNFNGKKKEMLLVPKQYLKDSKDTLLISISEISNDFDACYLGAVARTKINALFASLVIFRHDRRVRRPPVPSKFIESSPHYLPYLTHRNDR